MPPPDLASRMHGGALKSILLQLQEIYPRCHGGQFVVRVRLTLNYAALSVV